MRCQRVAGRWPTSIAAATVDVATIATATIAVATVAAVTVDVATNGAGTLPPWRRVR
jgi:hypothetical protein